ncbi:MAG: HEAT repeat domain-containing protein, partial [Bacteroidales bacterium]|nr:HEAT repeat domain-containing protein [Bacteroidales bacterium]
GIDIPDYMQGTPFLGPSQSEHAQYAFGFRGRMDERYDLSRTLRDKQYRYVHNFMPHRVYGGYIQYLWKAKSIQSWEKEYNEGRCNEIQSAFWQPKPVEELYDLNHDPDNVMNLASDPGYHQILTRMREDLTTWIIEQKDPGFIPEADLVLRSSGQTPFDLVRQNSFPIERIIETAGIAASGDPGNFDFLVEKLDDPESAVRYWAATGLVILQRKSDLAIRKLTEKLTDESYPVRIAASEALFNLGESEPALNTIRDILKLDAEELAGGGISERTASDALDYIQTHALNVLDVFGPAAQTLIRDIETIAADKEKNYSRRAAIHIADKFSP